MQQTVTVKTDASKPGIVQVHAAGCKHTRFGEEEFTTTTENVQEVAEYAVRVLSGEQDDGIASFNWTYQIAPCLKKGQ